MPYFEKSMQVSSLSLNHVTSKTAKPPLVLLSSLFSHSVDTTGRSSCEEDIMKSTRRSKLQASVMWGEGYVVLQSRRKVTEDKKIV